MTNDVKDGHEEEIGRGEGAITRVCAPCRPLDYNVMRMAVPAICPDVMDAVTQRHFSAGERLSINDQESHQITIVATGAVREQVILNDGRRKIMGFLLSGDGLDDAREIAGLTFVAAKSGIYYELTETALQRCRRNGMSVEDWKNLQRDRRLAAYGKHILLLGRYTAVDFQANIPVLPIDGSPQDLQLVQLALDKGLAAEPGIDAHHQDQVDHVHHLVDHRDGRRGVEHHAGLFSQATDCL